MHCLLFINQKAIPEIFSKPETSSLVFLAKLCKIIKKEGFL